MRIALYGRVSTKDKGQDTENQMIQLREFARVQGWTIVRVCRLRYRQARQTAPTFSACFRMLAEAPVRSSPVLEPSFSREGALETLQHLERLKTAAGVG